MLVYKITFPSGKNYIGQTTEKVSTRISHHKTDAKRKRDVTTYCPEGSKIGNAIRKYGLDVAWVEIVEKTDTIDKLNDLEIYWINKLDTITNGYNTKPGGSNKKHSNSTKLLIGLATKERWKDTSIADKMLAGLSKGVEKAKAKRGEQRVPRETRECPICGNQFIVRVSETKKLCSQKCAAKHASNIAMIHNKI